MSNESSGLVLLRNLAPVSWTFADAADDTKKSMVSRLPIRVVTCYVISVGNYTTGEAPFFCCAQENGAFTATAPTVMQCCGTPVKVQIA